MDPITQGILGAAASQAVAFKQKQHQDFGSPSVHDGAQRNSQILLITCIGLFTGMVPDLDAFINSKADPLLFLEYHRHFTHSLFFIPLGGFFTAALLFLLLRKRFSLTFKQIWFYCTAGYATHALIDTCTSYGTQLMWPLNNTRYAWNNMSIIDPLYTLPIIAFVVCGVVYKRKKWAYIAWFWILCYPLLGVVQRERAESVALSVAQTRGHENISGLTVKPSLGNLILWKSIYEYENYFYVDAVRVVTGNKVYEGNRIEKLAAFDNLQQHFPWLDLSSQQAVDIERFRWFSQGYIAQNPNAPMQVMDMRYSAIPNQIKPLWSIELSEATLPKEHVKYIVDTDNRRNVWPEFVRMLTGK